MKKTWDEPGSATVNNVEFSGFVRMRAGIHVLAEPHLPIQLVGRGARGTLRAPVVRGILARAAVFIRGRSASARGGSAPRGRDILGPGGWPRARRG
jgi:hypothetical protein